MSRVGNNPVTVPDGVDVALAGGLLKAKGKLGELEMRLHDAVTVSIEDKAITVKPRDESKRSRQMWGTMRNLVDNLVNGVATGFSKRLLIRGVGYRAAVQGKTLNLQLGFSHDINFPIPDGITITAEKVGNDHIVSVSGADKQRVGQVAAEIRSYRTPEPYKGKGVRYEDEYVLMKEGKKK